MQPVFAFNDFDIEILNQKPEKLNKTSSENINISSISDEITLKQIIPNNLMKKDTNNPYIIKEKEDLEDINKK